MADDSSSCNKMLLQQLVVASVCVDKNELNLQHFAHVAHSPLSSIYYEELVIKNKNRINN